MSVGSLAVLPTDLLFSQEDETDPLHNIATGYFSALPTRENKRSQAITDCANALCKARRTVSEETVESVRDGSADVEDFISHLRFGVRILNEHGITTAIDETTLERGQRATGELTKYLPLIGSFNNLVHAACRVETPDPSSEQVEHFLFAAMAFGIEIGLWSTGAPFTIAFRGTRFIANKTFLRFARHGCRGCVALAMSEIHWAIRGTIYSDAVTEDNIQYVFEQMRELQNEAENIDYNVDLDYSLEEIREIAEKEGTTGGGAMGPVNSEDSQEGPLDIPFPEFPSLPDIPDAPW